VLYPAELRRRKAYLTQADSQAKRGKPGTPHLEYRMPRMSACPLLTAAAAPGIFVMWQVSYPKIPRSFSNPAHVRPGRSPAAPYAMPHRQARIHSTPGRGTAISIFLPRHLGPADAPEGAAEASATPCAEHGETVLVVDDEPTVRMLVTDVGLPGGMNGRQLADAARLLRPGLKVLFITGYAENAILSHAHLDPGMHVLTKPFAMDALAGRIKELTTGR
jgi:hypothetical protein